MPTNTNLPKTENWPEKRNGAFVPSTGNRKPVLMSTRKTKKQNIMLLQKFVTENRKKIIDMKVYQCGPNSFVYLSSDGDLKIGRNDQHGQQIQMAFGGACKNHGLAAQELNHIMSEENQNQKINL